VIEYAFRRFELRSSPISVISWTIATRVYPRERADPVAASRRSTYDARRVRERTQSSPGLIGPGHVLGSYRLISLIGEGSVGRVYLAEHTKLGRKVALKMLKSELSHHPKLVNRFFLEARAVNEIAHENIVTITDFIDGEGGQYYFIMELLKGVTLDRLLSEEGPQSARFAASIGAQLASALSAVHSKGFIHRDLKPANVFLVPKDSGYFVKLLDFGVAKLMVAGGLPSPNTAIGDLVGTPDYMSPEQARAMTVDHRVDIYALGAVLYEIITGERVFPRDGLDAVLKAQILDTPTPPSAKRPLPAQLESLILRCLHKAPEQRPQTAAEVESELRRIMTALGKPSGRQNKSMAPLVLTIVAVLAAVSAAGYWWLAS
jgi:eukaryotic-like serine/threonine-protein kinase